MFEFTESVRVDAPPGKVWKLLADVERWWPPSNPEHIRIDVLGRSKVIEVGTNINFEERVAGVKGKASGTITRFIPEAEATWEGVAEYRYFGLRFQVHEGVSWYVDKDGEASRLSARVWAKFSSGMFGRLLEWYAKTLLNVIARDREHARCELVYLRNTIENNG